MKREKYKCFLEGNYKDKKIIFVPSFIDYFEGSDIRNEWKEFFLKINLKNFRVFIIGENLEVLDFGSFGKIN